MAAPVFNPTNNQWTITETSSDPDDFHGATAKKVKSVRWVGGTTAGHVVEIQEPGGKTLVKMLATAANFSDEVLVEEWWSSGFIVPTLASGILYVNYE